MKIPFAFFSNFRSNDVKCFGVTGIPYYCIIEKIVSNFAYIYILPKLFEMTLQAGESPENPQDEVEILLPNTTIVTHCILKDDIPRLTKSFEDDSDPFKETIVELVNERDGDGKAPLDLCSTLGRLEMTKELLQRGANVNSTTQKGH